MVERCYALVYDHATDKVSALLAIAREPLLLRTKDHNPPTQAYRSICPPLFKLRPGPPRVVNVEYVCGCKTK